MQNLNPWTSHTNNVAIPEPEMKKDPTVIDILLETHYHLRNLLWFKLEVMKSPKIARMRFGEAAVNEYLDYLQTLPGEK
jgi:hypothetical protein